MNNFDITIGEHISKELNKRGIKQSQMIELCKSVGMPISQPDLSKILSGKKGASVYQLASISKAIGVPMDFWVCEKDNGQGDFFGFYHSEKLISSGSELDYYEGKFYFYYLSTAITEEKILRGEMNIERGASFFELKLSLDTGERDFQSNAIRKEYTGRILVTLALGAAYLILKSDILGEICMICLRHRSYNTVKNVECRLGLALTMSAGEIKSPVAHRCLLVRKELRPEQLEDLRPWLYMVGEDIRVDKGKLEKLKSGLLMRCPEHRNEIEELERLAIKREYSEFAVEMLQRKLEMPNKAFVEFLTELYGASNKPRNYGITQTEEVRAYEKVSQLTEQPDLDEYRRQTPRSAPVESGDTLQSVVLPEL